MTIMLTLSIFHLGEKKTLFDELDRLKKEDFGDRKKAH